jgi:hypothetical protein
MKISQEVQWRTMVINMKSLNRNLIHMPGVFSELLTRGRTVLEKNRLNISSKKAAT